MLKRLLISGVIILIISSGTVNAAIRVNGKEYTYEEYRNSLYNRNNTTTNTTTNETNTTTNTLSPRPNNNTVGGTTPTPKKSDNANLKELTTNLGGMTPEFDENITEYHLDVGLDIEKIEVTTKTSDIKAKSTIKGNENLKEGENTITITVKAEDGTTKEYYIYVNKSNNVGEIEKVSNAELKSMQISNYELYPKFKTNIFDYNLNINNKISTLDIVAEPKSETAKVEIEGNENLKEGENVIKVKVTSEDGQVVIDYRINAYIFSESVQIEEEDKSPAVVLLITLGIIIVVMGMYMLHKRK